MLPDISSARFSRKKINESRYYTEKGWKFKTNKRKKYIIKKIAFEYTFSREKREKKDDHSERENIFHFFPYQLNSFLSPSAKMYREKKMRVKK